MRVRVCVCIRMCVRLFMCLSLARTHLPWRHTWFVTNRNHFSTARYSIQCIHIKPNPKPILRNSNHHSSIASTFQRHITHCHQTKFRYTQSVSLHPFHFSFYSKIYHCDRFHLHYNSTQHNQTFTAPLLWSFVYSVHTTTIFHGIIIIMIVVMTALFWQERRRKPHSTLCCWTSEWRRERERTKTKLMCAHACTM